MSEATAAGAALAKAAKDANDAEADALQQEAAVMALASKRKELLSKRTALQAEWQKHRLSAVKAHDSYISLRSKGTTAPAPLLETAKAEYEAARDAGTRLRGVLDELRSVEDEMNAATGRAAYAANRAQLAASAAASSLAPLRAVSKATTVAASAASTEASQARSQSGFYSESAYATARKRSVEAAEKLESDLQEARKGAATLAVKRRVADTNPKCDIRKTRWDRFDFPEVGKPHDFNESGEAVTLVRVEYADMSGDPAPEALVMVESTWGPNGGEQRLYIFAVSDASCTPKSLGAVTATAGCRGGMTTERFGRTLRVSLAAQSGCVSGDVRFREEDWEVVEGTFRKVGAAR